METKGCEKNAKKFCCTSCDYTTSRKSSYDKHLLTAKHKYTIINDTTVANSCEKLRLVCNNCNKKYLSRNGLWKHRQKCKHIADKTAQDNVILSTLILEIVKQNKELMKENIEFKDIMMDLAKNAGNTMINNIDKN
jgi:hypothetical protein